MLNSARPNIKTIIILYYPYFWLVIYRFKISKRYILCFKISHLMICIGYYSKYEMIDKRYNFSYFHNTKTLAVALKHYDCTNQN